MHEESLVRSLLRQVQDLGEQHQATEVEFIEVETGPLSGVEPLLLQSAFERLKGSTALCLNAALSIREVELDVLCLDCHLESTLQDFRFICQDCGSSTLKVLRGDSFRLLNVRMEISEAAAVCRTSNEE